jgi:DNA-binding response OmpR family regulator
MVNTLIERNEELGAERMLGSVTSPGRLASSGNTRSQGRAKVLIVDDEPDIVLSLGKRLRFAGYDIGSASDGMEATKMAIKMQPDVIILDIGMPCGDGHTVAERLRSNTGTMFAQIIFLTARVAEADRKKAMDAGAYGYLTKPFKSEELLQMIENALADNTF